MKINEAIILAGGLGSRLRPVVSDLPKCMAPVNGKPFLHYLIDYFRKQGIERFVFALGYRHEQIEEFLQEEYPSLDYRISIEKEPLGTGGAIRLACDQTQSDTLLLLNGDTFYKIDLAAASDFHFSHHAECTLLLKPMQNFERYGAVETGSGGRVNNFKEKQFFEKGTINGGVYALNKTDFMKMDFPEKFSFETDYLEIAVKRPEHRIFGMVQEGYFIDIGIPEDFNRAQTELPEQL